MGVAAQKVNQNLPNLGAEQKRGLFEALGVSVPGPETEKEQDYEDEEETEF